MALEGITRTWMPPRDDGYEIVRAAVAHLYNKLQH